MDANTVKRFVRETLGCGCEDEVFRRIVRDTLDDGTVAFDIGGRLLIHIVGADDVAAAESGIPRWVARGLSQRSSRGLNRFRLVIVTVDAARTDERLRPAFERAVAGDAKIHLHVIEPADLEDVAA